MLLTKPYLKFIREEQIDTSKDIWIFGYGSLMWRPDFPYHQKELAHLTGYHRRFCVYSMDHRGTAEEPGIVLGLDHGGSCHGVAFKIKGKDIESTFSYLWKRESEHTAKYEFVWINDKKEKALFFIMDREHPQFCDNTNIQDLIEIIIKSQGMSGSNIEYVENTIKHLIELNIQDMPMIYFWNQLQKRLSTMFNPEF